MTNAVIVVESCFGNTATIADAVAEGLRRAGAMVDVVPADRAPTSLSADLVLVGAPTHNFSLSTPGSRAQAAQRGAATTGPGVREWIQKLERLDAVTFTFATVVPGHFSGSAGAAARKQLRRRQIPAGRGPDFLVNGVAGPLLDGEIDRARAWGSELVAGR